MSDDRKVAFSRNVGESDFAALARLIEQARAGDRRSLKTLMFPYMYGMTKDETTGLFRAHTQEEIAAAAAQILGQAEPDTVEPYVQADIDFVLRRTYYTQEEE